MEKRDWKSESIKQWNADPCGADPAAEFGSAEFFERVRHQRYAEYAPWLPSMIDFPSFAGQRVLEVGFGLGTDHESLARAGAVCVGIDLTPRHIEATARRFRLAALVPRLVRGDAEALPFADASFDAVYSFGVLHHTPGTEQAIAEIYRVLRPGGRALVSLYHRNSAFFLYFLAVRGILQGGLARDGYRQLLSRVEKREHSDAVPLVKVYSRAEVHRLFSAFDPLTVRVDHLVPPKAITESPTLGRLARVLARRFEGQLGWYVTADARKPGARQPSR